MGFLRASYVLPMGFLLASYGLPIPEPLWFSLTFDLKRSTEPLSRDLGPFEGVSGQAKSFTVFNNFCFETFHGTGLSMLFLGARRRYRTLFNVIQPYSPLFNLIQIYSTIFNSIQPYSTPISPGQT